VPATIPAVSSIKTWTNSVRKCPTRKRVATRELRRGGPTTPCSWSYVMAQANSVGEVAAIPDRNQTVIDLGCVSAPPPPAVHPRGGRREEHCPTRKSEGTPLAGALALHGVSGDSGSHLGSTLKPGGAVLTLGVSRRSRSVACIRADASPSEVHVTPVGIYAGNATVLRQRNTRQDVVKIGRSSESSRATTSRASSPRPRRRAPRPGRRGSIP
jgi:hypothetical protein